MALIVDRVLETSTTTGTGNIALAGPVTGYQSIVGNPNLPPLELFPYMIVAVDANGAPTGQWETGLGCWDPGTSELMRGDPAVSGMLTGSSGENTLVDFAAGTKQVGLALTAATAMDCRVGAYLDTPIASVDLTTSLRVMFDYIHSDGFLFMEPGGEPGGAGSGPVPGLAPITLLGNSSIEYAFDLFVEGSVRISGLAIGEQVTLQVFWNSDPEPLVRTVGIVGTPQIHTIPIPKVEIPMGGPSGGVPGSVLQLQLQVETTTTATIESASMVVVGQHTT